jgi:hypothetical protein
MWQVLILTDSPRVQASAKHILLVTCSDDRT